MLRKTKFGKLPTVIYLPGSTSEQIKYQSIVMVSRIQNMDIPNSWMLIASEISFNIGYIFWGTRFNPTSPGRLGVVIVPLKEKLN